VYRKKDVHGQRNVKGLRKVLLGGQDYCIILGKDIELAGVYPEKNSEMNLAGCFDFAGPHGLFYLQTVSMSDKIAGWNKWHKRMGHVQNQSIKRTSPHAKGLQELEKLLFNQQDQCPSCMVGKAHLKI
jgi:hypothetical protein